MGFIHPTIFVTAALQKHKKFHLVTCWSVALAYDLAKHKICSSPITRNVGPRSWFQCGFLLSGHATPCFTLQGGPYPSAQQRAAVPCITRIFCQLSFLQNIFICSDHEINPTDHKSITAFSFPDKVLHQLDHKILIDLPSLPSHCRSIYTILTKLFICDHNHNQFWFAARMFSKAMSESTLQKCRDLTFDIKFSVPL